MASQMSVHVETGTLTNLTHPHHGRKKTHTSCFHQHNCHGIMITCHKAWWDYSKTETCLLLLPFNCPPHLPPFNPLKVSAVVKEWHSVKQQHSITQTRTEPNGPERDRNYLCTKLMFNHSPKYWESWGKGQCFMYKTLLGFSWIMIAELEKVRVESSFRFQVVKVVSDILA